MDLTAKNKKGPGERFDLSPEVARHKSDPDPRYHEPMRLSRRERCLLVEERILEPISSIDLIIRILCRHSWQRPGARRKGMEGPTPVRSRGGSHNKKRKGMASGGRARVRARARSLEDPGKISQQRRRGRGGGAFDLSPFTFDLSQPDPCSLTRCLPQSKIQKEDSGGNQECTDPLVQGEAGEKGSGVASEELQDEPCVGIQE